MNTKKLYKHMKKITNNKRVIGNREVLKYLHYNNYNNIVACDSHRMLKYYTDHEHENTLIDPNNSEVVHCDYKYPKTDSLILDKSDAKNVIKINSIDIDIIINILKAYKGLNVNTRLFINDDKSYYLHFNKLDLMDTLDNEHIKNINIDYTLNNTSVNDKNIKLTLNTKYLLNMFEFLKDHQKETNTTEYKIYIYGSLKIINISDDKDFNYILLPIRTY